MRINLHGLVLLFANMVTLETCGSSEDKVTHMRGHPTQLHGKAAAAAPLCARTIKCPDPPMTWTLEGTSNDREGGRAAQPRRG